MKDSSNVRLASFSDFKVDVRNHEIIVLTKFRSLDEVQRNPGMSLQDSRIPLSFIRATPLTVNVIHSPQVIVQEIQQALRLPE